MSVNAIEVRGVGKRYLLGQQNETKAELWVAPIDGSADPYRLRPQADFPEPSVARFLLTPDGSQVVFNAIPPGDNAYALYSVPIDGSADPVVLGDGPVQDSLGLKTPVDLWEVSGDSQYIAYVSTREDLDHFGVYSAEIGRSGTERLLNPEPRSNGSVLGPDAMTIAAGHVLYRATEYSSSADLISVPIRNPAGNRQISRNHTDTVNSVATSEEGGHVVYREGAINLWIVPVDGTSSVHG